jgi:hypothetical protein
LQSFRLRNQPGPVSEIDPRQKFEETRGASLKTRQKNWNYWKSRILSLLYQGHLAFILLRIAKTVWSYQDGDSRRILDSLLYGSDPTKTRAQLSLIKKSRTSLVHQPTVQFDRQICVEPRITYENIKRNRRRPWLRLHSAGFNLELLLVFA